MNIAAALGDSMNPNTPVTLWVIVTFATTVAVVGIPLLIGLLNYRRASREGQEKDVAALVAPIINACIKIHNEEKYAHPAALSTYTTREEFNGALRELRGELSGLRGVIDANEQTRKEDVKQFREDIRDLKSNVAAAVGGRRSALVK